MEQLNYALTLASASPRRQAFLQDLGFDFSLMPVDVDESPLPSELPIPLARRLAESKARAAAARLGEAGAPRLIVGADTVVALGDETYGKPCDEADAARMLRALRDRAHQVHSAVCVLALPDGEASTSVNSTTVLMRNYTDEEIRAYVATGDPLDKAGAYAIQHATFAPAASLDGCLTGVMGLPLGDMCLLLARYGVFPSSPVVEVCEGQTHFRCCRRGFARSGFD